MENNKKIFKEIEIWRTLSGNFVLDNKGGNWVNLKNLEKAIKITKKKTLIEIGNKIDKYKGLSSHQKLKLFKYFGLNPLNKDFGLI